MFDEREPNNPVGEVKAIGNNQIFEGIDPDNKPKNLAGLKGKRAWGKHFVQM